MKIERVSDTQLKLTLTKADLAERDIKLEDLIRPGEKTQQLFRDIMEQAMEECDFITENTPLMVEAVPVGLDGIMIIVTKVESKDKNSNPTELFNQQKICTDSRKNHWQQKKRKPKRTTTCWSTPSANWMMSLTYPSDWNPCSTALLLCTKTKADISW